MSELLHCPGLLVLELGAPAPAGAMLPTEVASVLADHVAADLARLVPNAQALDLALSGALLDPAQVLRPGWPVFAELGARLDRQRAGGEPRIHAFGSAGGRMVAPVLEPDRALGSGALMVLPFVLAGDAAVAQRTGTQLEEVLHEQGLAGAAVALLVKQALDLEVVHARYFTHRDLAALVAIQLEHAGCASAWSLLEAALFDREPRAEITSASGQQWTLVGEQVVGAALGCSAWLRGPGAELAAGDRAGAYAYWQAEQRRHAALFDAHGLVVAFRDGAVAGGAVLDEPWLLQALPAVDTHGEPELRAHEAPGLGVYAFSASRNGVPVAACYPLAAGAITAARDALRAHVGAAPGTPVHATRELPEP